MLEIVLALMSEWKGVFAQQRSLTRAIQQAISTVCVAGRKTITHCLVVQGKRDERWEADYKLHSRSRWAEQDLFVPMLREAVALSEGEVLGLGADDTRIRKTGKKIATALMGRDPLSPPFHVNLVRGLRFLHTSVLLTLRSGRERIGTLAIPVWFEEVPPLKKPGTTASAEQVAAYKEAKKQRNLPTSTVAMMREMRERVDAVGGEAKRNVFALDGSMTNRTTMREAVDRTEIIGRVRKDARLCFRAQEGGRRIYGEKKFTPEQVRLDESRAWQMAKIFWAGEWREIEYKQVDNVLWQRGAGQRDLRLLVIKPIPYRTKKNGNTLYREPGYLLCTVTEDDATPYLQIYFDRWQVEVVHRDLKTTLGVGEAQVRHPHSVSRQPVLHVATYSALRLAALICYGAARTDAIFGQRPRWQREKTRASCEDLVRKFRDEVVREPELLKPYGFTVTVESILATAVR